MERLPKITDRAQLPLSIQVPPYFMDHQFQGKAVLPAVEAMGILAASTLVYLPGTAVYSMQNIRFDKFLVIEADCARSMASTTLNPLIMAWWFQVLSPEPNLKKL